MKKILYGAAGGGIGFVVGFAIGLVQCIFSCNWFSGDKSISMGAAWVCLVIGVIIGVGVGIYEEAEDSKFQKEDAERRKYYEINSVFDQIEGDSWGYRNWANLNKLRPEFRQDRICIDRIYRVRELYFKSYANFVYMGNYEINHLSFGLKDLLAIPEIQNEARILLTHADYFNAISDRLKSIFTNCSDISSKLEEIKKQFESQHPGLTPLEIVAKELTAYQHVFDDAQAAIRNDNYFHALRLILWCDKDIDSLKRIRDLLIYDSFITSKNEIDLKNSDTLKNIYQMYYAKMIPSDSRKDANVYYYPSIDLLAAQAIVYSRGNIVDNINKSLDTFLSVLGKDGLEASQYEALRKVFEYLKAYKQEEKVLNAMFENNVVRTPEQESRLAFLKNPNFKNTPNMLSEKAKNNEVLYDYRSVKWSVQETRSYFDALTMNSRVLTMPMVVKEWAKNISVNDMKWQIKEVGSVIEQSLVSNFGERFQMKYVESGASTEAGTETDPSIYIYETGNTKNNYPWLAFIVKGDQLTLSQVNLAIYTLFVPGKVELQGTSFSQKNTELCNMLLVLKEEQNPKINNYLTTMSKVLDQEIVKWFEGNISDSMY